MEYPACCFGTGVTLDDDGLGVMFGKCPDHPEIENAREVYRDRQRQFVAEYKAQKRKEGSTYHLPGCTCGFCKMGTTRF